MSSFMILWNVAVMMLTAVVLLVLNNPLAAFIFFIGFFCWRGPK